MQDLFISEKHRVWVLGFKLVFLNLYKALMFRMASLKASPP